MIDTAPDESQGRAVAQLFALLIQTSLLLRSRAAPGAGAVAEGFCATRLISVGAWGAVFGAGNANLLTTTPSCSGPGLEI